MRRRRAWWFFAVAMLAVVLAAVAAGCGGDEEAAPPAEPPPAEPAEPPAEEPPPPPAEEPPAEPPAEEPAPVECSASIGIMAPITGPAGTIGMEQLNWGRLAVERVAPERGVSITLVEGDTQLDPAQASTVAPQMVSNEAVVAVVGPAGSQEIDAVGQIFGDAGMPFVSPSATDTTLTTTKDYPTFFRVVPRDDDQAATDARFMVEELGATTVFMVDDQSSYSTGLADQTQQLLEDEFGVEVVRESVSQDQTDFSALVSSIPDDAQIVFLPWQIAANAQLFGDQMAEQGKDQVIFGSDGLFAPGDFTIEGSYISSFAPDIRGIPEDAELVEAFESQYGDFGTFGPPVYEATQVVIEAIARVCEAGEEPTREAVLEQIRQTDIPLGILGVPIQFDENGDILERRFFIFQIQGGEYALVQ